jgi:Universal stress protein family
VTHGTLTGRGLDGRSVGWREHASRRVLAVYEEGRSGAAVLLEASELAAAGAQVTVVTLAPQAQPLKCCGGGGAGPYNCAIRDAAAQELLQARTLLGSLADRASFTTLIGTPARRLGEWAAARTFDVIVVPRHGLGRGGGRLARELRRETAADVRAAG